MGPVVTLLEAEIRLYREAPDGSVDIGSAPVIIGSAERLRLKDGLIEVETRPTGTNHPRVHHLGEIHEISIERVWRLDERALVDYQLQLNQRYVLVMGWTEDVAERPVWYSRTYYGVTDQTAEMEAQSRQGSLTPEHSLQWRAEQLVCDGGDGVYVFQEDQIDPEMYVQWVKGWETLRLFDYDTVNGFTETSAGISGGRASISTAGDLLISIEGEAAMRVEDGELVVGELIEAPGIAAIDSPRLEFWRGSQRLATLSKDGRLRVFAAAEETPSYGTERFHFSGTGGLVATLSATGLQAVAIVEE
jgi:hypothetical protein